MAPFPRGRKIVTVLHIVTSVALLGEVWALVALNIYATVAADAELAHSAYRLMEGAGVRRRNPAEHNCADRRRDARLSDRVVGVQAQGSDAVTAAISGHPCAGRKSVVGSDTTTP